MNELSDIKPACPQTIYKQVWRSSFGDELSACEGWFSECGDLWITTTDSGGLIRELLQEDVVVVNYRVDAQRVARWIQGVCEVGQVNTAEPLTEASPGATLSLLATTAARSELNRLSMVDALEPYRLVSKAEARRPETLDQTLQRG